MPQVSVIIPCYNQSRYLLEAIESALAQTYRDFEIIVVDDGSTDETPKVIGSFGESVRAIRQDNKGLSAARNAGILAARGEFIGLLDADDLWMPEYLERMLPLLEPSGTVGAVYCGWQYMDAAGNPFPRTNINVVTPGQAYEKMVYMDFLIPSGVLVRRECIDRLGLFDISLRSCEDWDMWLRILGEYRMVGVPLALVQYRLHGDNMSSNLERMEIARRAVIVKHFGAEEDAPAGWPDTRRRAYGGFYLISALPYFQRGQLLTGRRYLQRAFNIFPEMTRDLDAFYMIACADQPTGVHTVFDYLDLPSTVRNLSDTLEAIFDDPIRSPALWTFRSQAYGYAYLALGLLAYGSRHMGEARRYFLQAIHYRPRLLLHPRLLPQYIKSFVGGKLKAALKGRPTRVGHGVS